MRHHGAFFCYLITQERRWIAIRYLNCCDPHFWNEKRKLFSRIRALMGKCQWLRFREFKSYRAGR
jgi:hypothetical protein